MRAHLEAENAWADEWMAPLAALREELYRELAGRLLEADEGAPFVRGGWLYFWRIEAGQQHRSWHRRRPDGGDEQLLIDLNARAGDGRYIALGDLEASDDGRYVALTLDRTGFREYRLEILDTESGALLPDAIERVTSLAWAADGTTLLYATEDAAKRPHRVLRHRLGAGVDDEPVFEELDERFRVDVRRTRSGAFVVVTSASHTASEVRLLAADDVASEPRLVAPRADEHEYYVDDAGDALVVRSNRSGRNFALFEAPHGATDPEEWIERIAHDPETMLERADAFRGRIVVTERHRGLPRFRIVERASGSSRFVDFPEPAFDAAPGPNEEFDAPSFRYVYQSMTTPPSVFDHDFAGGISRLVKRDRVPGYDPALYVTERIEAVAADGARIPISLVRRRDTPLPAPALLKGYGAYGISYPAAFDRNGVSLVDRGVVIAIAHVRGGADLGQSWHDAGRMAAKANSFSDFVAAGEALVAHGVARRDALAAIGGSAGGLLVTAAVNLRRDLFRAVVALVPFVDVVRTMSDATLPLTVGEYEEWGNPAIAEQYRWMRAYSPYDNLEPGDYPAMLVRTSFWDSQVMYWEPAKYVARLRERKTDSNPLLFVTNLDAGGHGGFAGRYDRLRDSAFDFAFLLRALGAGG